MENQIAAATGQLKAATTDAEAQKLQGVLLELSAALNDAAAVERLQQRKQHHGDVKTYVDLNDADEKQF